MIEFAFTWGRGQGAGPDCFSDRREENLLASLGVSVGWMSDDAMGQARDVGLPAKVPVWPAP